MTPSAEQRFSLYYALLFGSIGAIAPFAALWMDHAGIEASMIGAIVAAPSVAMLLTTMALGRWADRLTDRRQAIIFGNWIVLIVQLVLFATTNTWVVLCVWLVSGVVMYAKVPITDASALSLTRRLGSDFARIRVFGSLGFVLVLTLAGYLYELLGIHVLVVGMLLMNVLRLLAAYQLPSQPRARTTSSDSSFRESSTPESSASESSLSESSSSEGSAPESSAPESSSPKRSLLKCSSQTSDPDRATERGSNPLYQPAILLTLLGSAMINASHAMVNTYGILLWTQDGLSESLASQAIGVGVVVEVAMMWWFKSMTRNVSARACLLVAAICGLLRWSLLAGEPSIALIFIAQALHGITFGVMFLASASFISRRVPDESAALGQSLLAIITTACMATATFGSGQLFDTWNGSLYWIMALMCGLSMLCIAGSYWFKLGDTHDVP